MAGDDERKTVAGAERPDGALGSRISGELRQLAVGDDLAVGDRTERAHDVELKRRPPVGVDLDLLKVDLIPVEIRAQLVDELFRFCSGPATDTRAVRR